MNQFVLNNKLRLTLLACIAIGIVCMAITYMVDADPHHSRFWSNFLHNSVFFTGIAFAALFFYSANIVGLAGWYVQFKRLWESYSLFLIVGIVLMVIVGLTAMNGMNALYHWADPGSVANDEILQEKSSFLNFTWYFVATVGFVGIWYLIALQLRRLSLKEDKVGTMDYRPHKKMRTWASIFLPLGGFSMAAVVWLWIMSVDAHWYSTLFVWYCGSSWIVAMFALTILMLIYLKNKGYLEMVTIEHLHDMGKYLFAISIFWTYLWFSQYMLIWYANIGEETIYFKERLDDYPVLFYANVFLNFVLPFFILLRNDTKRKYGTMILTSILVFFGHWIDYFLMIKPGVLHTAHELAGHHGGSEGAQGTATHAAEHGSEALASMEHGSAFVDGFTLPGILEIGTFVGFLGLFLLFTFAVLSRSKLMPARDPYLEESKHHHVEQPHAE